MSMYETIMDLPIFRGIGKDQVSLFLEKFHIEFVNYANGDLIVNAGEEVQQIKFIFSGHVLLESENMSGSLLIRELRPSGTLLAGRHVFGRFTTFPYTVRAHGRVSVLQMTKDQFFALLQTDRIYSLNMLNYLSSHAQRSINTIRFLVDGSLERYIGLWVSTMTDPSSLRIELECSKENFSRLTNLSLGQVDSALLELDRRGIAQYEDGILHIPSRTDYLNEVFDDE